MLDLANETSICAESKKATKAVVRTRIFDIVQRALTTTEHIPSAEEAQLGAVFPFHVRIKCGFPSRHGLMQLLPDCY